MEISREQTLCLSAATDYERRFGGGAGANLLPRLPVAVHHRSGAFFLGHGLLSGLSAQAPPQGMTASTFWISDFFR